MNEMKDPILKEETTPADEQDFFTDGLYIIRMTKEQIENLGIFYNDLYQKISKKKIKKISRNANTMLHGAIFALGSRSLNVEWKEHCAGSLREILHEWHGTFAGDFRELYPNSPKSEETEVYKDMQLHYNYFSGIAHHDAAGIMHSLQSIKNDSMLKLEHCYQNDIFIERVRVFLILLDETVTFSN